MGSIQGQGTPRFEWPVPSDCWIEDGRLIVVPAVARLYDPFDRKELPGEIAKLKPGDPDGLREFVLRYGTFGYAPVVNAVEEYKPDPELLFDLSEPLDWIWAHANGIRLVMEGIRILHERDEGKAVKYLACLLHPDLDLAESTLENEVYGAVPQGEDMAVYEAPIGLREATLAQRWILRAPQVRPLATVGEIVGGILTANLALNRREVYYDAETGSIRSTFVYDAMIQAVYQQLLETAEGGRVEECDECHALFIQTDGRQHFCPPRFKEKESRCALRYRQREWRKRRRQEGGSKDGQA